MSELNHIDTTNDEVAERDYPIDYPARDRSPKMKPHDAAEFAAVDMHDTEREPIIINPQFKYPESKPHNERTFFSPNKDQAWWQWPDPIDNVLVRLISFIIFLMMLAVMLMVHYGDKDTKRNAFIIPIVALGDFVLRTTFGPTPFSPIGMLATMLLYIFNVKPNLVPSNAKRFSAFLGIFVTFIITMLYWWIATDGTKEFAVRPCLALTIFAGLESVLGFCVGCWMFSTFFKIRDKWNAGKAYAKLRVDENPAKKTFNPAIDTDDCLPCASYFRTGGGNVEEHGFDVDLVVIGGGSAGLSCAKEAARLGKKVVVLEYFEPSWQGSTAPIGGCCVTVGCIPKKMCHTAAIQGHVIKNSAFYYGWRAKQGDDVPARKDVHFSWESLVDGVQEHIAATADGTERGLAELGIQRINALGSFVDANTIKMTTPDGKEQTITARRTLIATGGRPRKDNIPGAEHCISSDDVFSLKKNPGRTLVVGAGYIATECAGFLAGLDCDTVLMARSQLLRGFDRDMAKRIVDNMKIHGVQFLVGFKITKIEKMPDGKLEVFYKATGKVPCDSYASPKGVNQEQGTKRQSDPTGCADEDKANKDNEPAADGAAAAVAVPEDDNNDKKKADEVPELEMMDLTLEYSDIFDTVLTAIGRVPNTAKLNLAAAGVEMSPDKKIYHYNERTTTPNIYVAGDVGSPSIELQPVAARQGLLLAQRLYKPGGSDVTFNFSTIATTIFTPLEYGSIGVSEEKANELFGADNVEVYHSEFTPLEAVLPRCKGATCYVKVIVNYLDHSRVVGMHFLGPNAGEVIQGFACAFAGKEGLRYKDLTSVVGVHPVCAEELVLVRKSKRSGLDAKKTSC